MALDKWRKSICGIYKITNIVNKKCYIGQSIDIENRWRQHKLQSSWRKQKEKALYRAFIKYGLENFVFEIIEECKRKDLDRREIYWIKKYNSCKCGYNMTKGGQGDRDYRFRHKRIVGDSYYDVYELLTKPNANNIFQEVKYVLLPCADKVNNISECDDEDIVQEFDGYDTLIRDFCDGYDSFEQWAECNLM